MSSEADRIKDVLAAHGVNVPNADGESSKTSPEDQSDNESSDAEEEISERVATDETTPLGKHIDIYFKKPLEKYQRGEIKAYQAKGTGEKEGNHIAFICEKHLIPRSADISVYRRIVNLNAASVISSGIVNWPSTGSRHFCIVYQGGFGDPFIPKGQELALGMKQDEVMNRVLKPILQVLEDFSTKDFVHGAINLGNIFDRGDKSNGFLLGECLSAPTGSLQPAVYSTIEKGMSNPIGRGLGAPSDDLYALGVVLTIMMRNSDPLHGMSDNEIVKQKIAEGSYAALTGKDKFKGSINELLRGLLHDDPKERWTVEEMRAWTDGQRLRPKQTMRMKKASRPVEMGGKKYFMTNALAMDLFKDKDASIQLIEGGDLSMWIQRSLENKNMLENLEKSVKAAKEYNKGAAQVDRILSASSNVLDPWGPMRFRDIASMGDGIGFLLANTVAKGGDVNIFAEIFSKGVAQEWLRSTSLANVDVNALYSKMDACKNHVSNSARAGFGLERCLYLLCASAPCFSPVVKDYYVRSPEDLVMAFEDMCRKNKAPIMFLDRHSIAFIASKELKCVDPFLPDLNAKEQYRRITGNLNTLAAMQNRLQLKGLPSIAAHFTTMLDPIYARYHDKQVKDKLKKNIARYARDGDLVKMAGLLDNKEVHTKDFGQFKKALAQYAALKKEHERIEENLSKKDGFGQSTGTDIAAIVSSIIAGLIIVFVVIGGAGGALF